MKHFLRTYVKFMLTTALALILCNIFTYLIAQTFMFSTIEKFVLALLVVPLLVTTIILVFDTSDGKYKDKK